MAKCGKEFGYWCEDQKKEDADPDALTIIFMAHYLKKNITLISGKGDKWKTDDLKDDIVLVYKGDHSFTPTDVGTYQLNINVNVNEECNFFPR